MPAVVVDSPQRARTIPAVPDLPLHFGNSDTGRALPPMARSSLEAVFGLDLSSVRVHLGAQPAELGARAFAHGTDLYFLPEVYDPASAAGLGEIAHELVHVCQQQRGRTATGGGPLRLVRDAAQEAQAERVARLVSRNDARARRVIGELFGGLDRLSPPRARWDILQPNIHVKVDGEYVHLTSTDDALRKINAGCKDQTVNENFGRLKNAIRPILHDWIHASTKTWKRIILNQKEHTVRYKSWDNLARSLLGEVRSRGNQQHENYLAKETIKSDWVNTQLADFLTFCNSCLALKRYKNAAEKIAEYKDYKGAYNHWYFLKGFKNVLAGPSKCSFENKIAVIHDLVKPFEQVSDTFGDVPDDKCYSWALVPNGVNGYTSRMMSMSQGNRENTFRKGSLGDEHLTLIEESEIIQTYREHDTPVGFGPSFTTGRTAQCCWELCDLEGKSPGSERTPWIAGIAWGLFAFWNVSYWQQFSRAHTFHEAMGMAYNYGVPYIPFTYPSYCPTNEDPFPTGEIL